MVLIGVRNVSKQFRRQSAPKLIRDHLRRRFRKDDEENIFFYALKDITFEVAEGEGVAVVGANGAGKSTLLSLICQLGRPDSGSITVQGTVAALLELGSGFHPDLTGTENVYLNAALLGFTEKQAKESFPQIVDFSELADFMDEPLRTYSAGMMARLAFSVAVHSQPDILVVDEVLGVGDVGFQEKCHRRVEEMRTRGVTLLVVSHGPGPVLDLCERAIWLHEGELIQDGPAGDVITRYVDFITGRAPGGRSEVLTRGSTLG